MNDAVRDALRIAKRPVKPVRFHHTVARKGYAEGGDPHIEGEVAFAPPQEPVPVQQPDDAKQEAFLKEQLKGSAPQYDPAAGIHTAKEAGLMAAGMIPGTGLAAAAGKFPTAEGGFEPSLKEDIQKGEYLSAGLKGLGAAGDVLQAVPVVGTAAGAALKAPLAVKLATAMAPAARLAREAAPVAEAAQEAAPAARAIEASVEAAPALTKSQSQEAMKAAWEAGQGNTEKFKNWNHQWNVEEGPKFAKQQQVQEAVPVEPSAVAEPVSTYKRLVNPAGFYSRAHEVAMNELPAEPRTWQEMYSLLSKAPRVVGEELYWSGLRPEAFAPGEKVSREQIAQLIEKNFPQVHPEIRAEVDTKNINELEDALRQSETKYSELGDQYRDLRYQVGREGIPTVTELRDIVDTDPGRARELIEKLPDELKSLSHELVDAMESRVQVRRELESARDLYRERRSTVGMPKYMQYTVPGGTDYEERILKHQYNPIDGRITPEVDAKYAPERQRIFGELRQASGDIAQAERNWYKSMESFVDQMRRDYVELQKAERGIATPEQLQQTENEFETAINELLAAENNPAIPQSEIDQIRQKALIAENRYKKIKSNTEQGFEEEALALSDARLANALGRDDEFERVRIEPPEVRELKGRHGQLQKELDALTQKAREESRPDTPAYTQERYTHTHWDNTENPVVHTRNSTRTGPEGEKIWHQEELQSDWAQQGRERGFRLPEQELEKLKDKVLNKMDEITNFYKGLPDRERLSLGDIDSDFERIIKGEQPLYMGRSARSAALVDELKQSYGALKKADEAITPSAPYTRDTAHWLELAAKDTLAQAIERGYDKIFITGGQEQAKRWQNQLRQAVDNVSWSAPPNADEIQAAQKTVDDYYATITKLNNEMNARYGHDWYNTHPEVHADYSKQAEEIDRRMSEAQKILEAKGGLASAYPGAKVVYAKPVGGLSESYFVVKPVEANGKTRYEVIDSSIPSAKGETLSSVIGGDLAKRVMAEESGNVPMKGYRMGSEGYTQTYERKAPSIYKKLIRSLDPEAKVEAGPLDYGDKIEGADLENMAHLEFTQKQFDKWLDPISDMARAMETEGSSFEEALERYAPPDLAKFLKNYFKKESVGGTYIQITPKMREEYNRLKQKFGSVFPAYKRGGKVDGKSKIRYNKPEHALKIARKYAQ